MNGTTRPGTALRPREREVVAAIANGYSTIREIADAMGLSPHTVHSTLRRAYVRLGITDAAHGHRYLVVRRAREAGAIRYVDGRTVPVAFDSWENTRDLLARRRVSREPIHAELEGMDRMMLADIANGWTNRKIASSLNISERRAKKHLERIYLAIDAVNRAHAAVTASRLGLIRWDGQQWTPAPRA